MSDPTKYTVGWICAIKAEFVAAQLFLDKKHDPPSFVSEHDNNSYKLGQIGDHNVVIAVLPDGEYGTSLATAVARDMLHTFTNIRIGLMVGIGGGAPTSKNDIRLGDVVVSSPKNGNSGVFQYDFGKTIQSQAFQHTKHLDQPPTFVRAAVANLQADHELEGHSLREAIDEILNKNKRLKKYRRPDLATDVLYRSDAIHPIGVDDCQSECSTNPDKIVTRKLRDEDEDDDPAIHYGLIASANQLMKDATVRDRLAAERGVLCFEMEAAGLMNHFPCLVIRGICDYSDTHKNDVWHGYAAMTAAAYAAELLRCIPRNKIEAERKIFDVIELVKNDVDEIKRVQKTIQSSRQDDAITRWLNAPNPASNHNAARHCRLGGTGTWLLGDHRYTMWKETPGSFLWLNGKAGCGKTILSSTIIDDIHPFSLVYFYFSFSDKGKQTFNSLARSLLHQLYYKNQHSKACVESLLKVCTGEHTGTQPTSSQLYECLVESLNMSNDRFHIVIDALDESTDRDGSHGLLTFLKRLREDTKQKSHILVTSRAEPDIEMAISNWSLKEERVSLQKSALDQDIESYIDSELSPGGRFDRWQGRPQMLDRIKSTLVEKSEQMFRWVACQLDSLAKCFDPATLQRELSSLPLGLDETYQRMIQNLPSESKDKSITLLRLVLFSSHPLTVDELVDAVAVDLTTPTKFDPDLRMPIQTEICRFCPGLVVAEKTFERQSVPNLRPHKKKVLRIRLAHYSVKEFLLSGRLHGDLGKLMNPSVSRASLSAVCVGYLSALDETYGRKDTHPFSSYCAKNWLSFAARGSADIDEQFNSLAVEFLLSNKLAYHNWFRIFDPDRCNGSHYSLALIRSRTPPQPAPGLYYASLYGIVPLVETLLSNNVDVNLPGGWFGYPLHAAAYQGRTEVVKILLKAGADVDAKSPKGKSALSIASAEGHLEIVQCLLRKVTDPKALEVARQDCLRSACSGNWTDIAHLMLSEGAKADSDALVAACSRGNLKLIQLLLNNRADVNRQALNGEFPLGSAACKGHIEAVSMLLEHGAILPEKPQKAGFLVQTVNTLNTSEGIEANTYANMYYRCYGTQRESRTGCRSSRSRSYMLPRADCRVSNGKSNRDVTRLIMQHFAEVDSFICGAELEIAIYENDEDYVGILLDKFVGQSLYCYANRTHNALGTACRLGNCAVVQALLEKGVDANSVCGSYGTALMTATSNGQASVVSLLLQYGAEARTAKPNDWKTPLRIAYDNGNWNIMKILMEHGADTYETMTPRYRARTQCSLKIVQDACLDNNTHAIDVLLAFNVPLDVGLSTACFRGNLVLAKKILETGVAPTTKSLDYGEPLVSASYEGHINIVHILVESYKTGTGTIDDSHTYDSALAAASDRGHLKVVKYLVDNKTDLGATHMMPLAYRIPEAIYSRYSRRGPNERRRRIPDILSKYGSAIAAAASAGHQEVVKVLLESDMGTDPRSSYSPALEHACVRGHREIVRSLVEYGADLTAPGRRYPSMLIAAAASGSVETVQYILDLGLDPNEQFDGDRYSSALHAALLHRSEEVARILLMRAEDGALQQLTERHGDLLLAVFRGAPDDATSLSRGSWTGLRFSNTLELLISNGADALYEQEDYDELLCRGSEWGLAKFVTLLITKGANINSFGRNDCAWELAFENQHAETLWTLLDHDCDINGWEKKGSGETWFVKNWSLQSINRTLMHLAAEVGRLDVVRRCISTASDIRWHLERDPASLTLAVENDHEDIVSVLLEAGADVFSCPGNHETMLGFAMELGHEGCAQVLRQHLIDLDYDL